MLRIPTLLDVHCEHGSPLSVDVQLHRVPEQEILRSLPVLQLGGIASGPPPLCEHDSPQSPRQRHQEIFFDCLLSLRIHIVPVDVMIDHQFRLCVFLCRDAALLWRLSLLAGV